MMSSKKNIKVGILNKFLIIICIFFFNISNAQETNMVGTKTDIKILDKISSKNELISLINGEEFSHK